MILVQIKKYLYEYKKIVASICVSVFIIGVISLLANQIAARGHLFEPFKLGVVSEDNSLELNILLNIGNTNESLAEFMTLERLSEDKANEMLQNGDIPAYIKIPNNFVEDIKVGENSPFTFVGNTNSPITLAISKILAKAGVAFLTSSQSGIYATIDFAYENGMDYDTINQKIVYPINYEFALKLLGYEDFFETRVISQTGDITLGLYYLYSFAVFFILINSIILLKTLKESSQAGIYQRFKACGFSDFKINLINYSGIFPMILFFVLPLSYFFTYKIIFIALAVSSFVFMSSYFFKSESAGGMFIFSAALFMLFASGGIIPSMYLPKIFNILKYFTINYWVIGLNTNNFSVFALIVQTIIFLSINMIGISFKGGLLNEFFYNTLYNKT